MRNRFAHVRNSLFKLGCVALAAACVSGGSAYAQRFAGAASFLQAAQKGENRPADASYWIGVFCEPPPAALRAQLNLADEKGLLVQDVVKDSPADKAGLKQFDVLLSIGDEPLASPQDLARLVVASRGEELTIRYLRGAKEASVQVKPAERPSRFEFNDWVVPEGDQAQFQHWLERLRPGMESNPLAMRFFHPGMVLPPETAADARQPDTTLPDDMSVTITKQGKEPAKISVKQGERSWEVAEDKLNELPDEARLAVERMLGRARSGVSVLPGRGAARSWQQFRQPVAPAPENREGNIERQLDELRAELRRLQQAVEKLQPQPAPEN